MTDRYEQSPHPRTYFEHLQVNARAFIPPLVALGLFGGAVLLLTDSMAGFVITPMAVFLLLVCGAILCRGKILRKRDSDTLPVTEESRLPYR
jgi:hypothetical protein